MTKNLLQKSIPNKLLTAPGTKQNSKAHLPKHQILTIQYRLVTSNFVVIFTFQSVSVLITTDHVVCWLYHLAGCTVLKFCYARVWLGPQLGKALTTYGKWKQCWFIGDICWGESCFLQEKIAKETGWNYFKSNSKRFHSYCTNITFSCHIGWKSQIILGLDQTWSWKK